MVFQTFGNCGAAIRVGDLLLFVLEGEVGPEALDCPVKDVVVLEATLVVKVLEEATKEGIVGSVFEREFSAVVHVGGHLFGISLTQELYRGVNFALFDFLILLVLVFGTLESLPRQLTFKHVE